MITSETLLLLDYLPIGLKTKRIGYRGVLKSRTLGDSPFLYCVKSRTLCQVFLDLSPLLILGGG